MIEQFISNLFGGATITTEQLMAAKSKLRRSPVFHPAALQESKRRLRSSTEIYNIARGKVCPPGKKLSKNKRCIKNKLTSPKRKSKSPKRKSKSPKRKSKSPKRKSKKAKSPKRKSKKAKSPKRKSKKAKSPKRKSKKRSTKRK